MRIWAVFCMTTTRRGPCPVKRAADGTRIRVEILPGVVLVSSAQTGRQGRALAWVRRGGVGGAAAPRECGERG